MLKKRSVNLLFVGWLGLACTQDPAGANVPGPTLTSGSAGGPAGVTGTAGMPASGGAPNVSGSAVTGGTPGSGGAGVATSAAGASAGVAGGGAGGTESGEAERWVGTWSTAPQLTEASNLPPAPGLANRTLRQIFYVSIGGTRLRVHLSNAYGTSSVTLNAVHLASSTSGHAIDAATDHALTFDGMPSITIPAGGTATSDALEFVLAAQTKVALSIAFGATPADVTGHPGSRTTSYIAPGDVAAAPSLMAPVTAEHWYFATGIDVVASTSNAAVVALGDSITDGRGSTTDANNRWPDDLSRRLRQDQVAKSIAVLNQGIGGNAVLKGGLGPPASQRFERDVLAQAGVRWLILLHGVNDIGAAANQSVAQQLIAAYQQLVAAAHDHDIKVYGVPILPFGSSMYDSADHEAARQTVNNWIRATGNFDHVIDLEAVVRDPASPARLLAAYDSGDHLHPNTAGYQKMADAIDLALFGP